MTVFRFVSSQLTDNRNGVLPNFEVFIAVIYETSTLDCLIKTLLMGLEFIGQQCQEFLEDGLMFIRLKPLMKWPGQEELQKSLPIDYRSNQVCCHN